MDPRSSGYEIRPYRYESARCNHPIALALAIWGDKDELVPVTTSLKLIQHALKDAANTNCHFKIFKNARHGLTLSDESRRFPDGTPELDWAPGYIPLQTTWIKTLF